MKEDKNKYILSINGMSKSFGRNKVLKDRKSTRLNSSH